jgi:hypothetical protein
MAGEGNLPCTLRRMEKDIQTQSSNINTNRSICPNTEVNHLVNIYNPQEFPKKPQTIKHPMIKSMKAQLRS